MGREISAGRYFCVGTVGAPVLCSWTFSLTAPEQHALWTQRKYKPRNSRREPRISWRSLRAIPGATKSKSAMRRGKASQTGSQVPTVSWTRAAGHLNVPMSLIPLAERTAQRKTAIVFDDLKSSCRSAKPPEHGPGCQCVRQPWSYYQRCL